MAACGPARTGGQEADSQTELAEREPDAFGVDIGEPVQPECLEQEPDASEFDLGEEVGPYLSASDVCRGLGALLGDRSPTEVLDLALGRTHLCALFDGGLPECWGSDHAGEASPPADVVFRRIAVGLDHSCGISADGGLRCWGSR